jgi:hypothetical protein
MIPPGCPTPLFIEPLGAVDKATDPWHRLILDARLSNKLQGPWGVWYSSVYQLAAMLDVCDIMLAEDLEDAYHLSIFAGCTGQPFWSQVFVIDEHGQVVRQWRLVMGCDASSCLGVCDKSMSALSVDGFVCFAAAHFGQRNAGSLLNTLMRCIQRFLARRVPPPPALALMPPPADHAAARGRVGRALSKKTRRYRLRFSISTVFGTRYWYDIDSFSSILVTISNGNIGIY